QTTKFCRLARRWRHRAIVHQGPVRAPRHQARVDAPSTRAGCCDAQSYLLQRTSHFVWTPWRHCRSGRNLICGGTFWSGAAGIAIAELAKFVRESAMITGTELLEALPVAVYTTDADGRITFYNRAAAELWGHHPELGSSQWCGSWRLYWPDGRPLPHNECPMAIALKEGREVRGVEAIAERPDGTRVRFLPYPTPLRDSSGRLVG